MDKISGSDFVDARRTIKQGGHYASVALLSGWSAVLQLACSADSTQADNLGKAVNGDASVKLDVCVDRFVAMIIDGDKNPEKAGTSAVYFLVALHHH